MQRRGIKFEKHKTVLNVCQPDAVIIGTKIAIFVDGDYWHANPKKYASKQLTNVQIDRVRRDKKQTELLEKDNWIILRFWESEIKKDVKTCIDKLENYIERG
jgi:DNA mismatch endonuclease (patch repair protein)